jgi:ParB family transcriptional regulator, chromosome partitioning protein
VRVRFGHRRDLAAIEASQSTVPVIVIAEEASGDTAKIERLLSQYAESRLRTGLSTAEQVTWRPSSPLSE